MGLMESKTSGKAGLLHVACIRHRAALGKQHFCIKCGGSFWDIRLYTLIWKHFGDIR